MLQKRLWIVLIDTDWSMCKEKREKEASVPCTFYFIQLSISSSKTGQLVFGLAIISSIVVTLGYV